MKKRVAGLFIMLLLVTAMAMTVSACGSKNNVDKSDKDKNSEMETSIPTEAEQEEETIAELPENYMLRQIDYHEGFWTFAIYKPKGHQSSERLCVKNSEEGGGGDLYMFSNPSQNGWTVYHLINRKEEPSLDQLQIQVTDKNTGEVIYLDNWGEPASEEERRECGIYTVEGHQVLIRSGAIDKLYDKLTFFVEMKKSGKDLNENSDDMSSRFLSAEDYAQYFTAYASDGTPLEEYMGIGEMSIYGELLGVYVSFPQDQMEDVDAEAERLKEAKPYLEYNGTDGSNFRFYLEFK